MLATKCFLQAESPHSGSVATISEGEVKRAVEDLWLKLGEQLDRLEAQSTSAPLPR